MDSHCGSKQFTNGAVFKKCTASTVVQMFGGENKGCMPHLVKLSACVFSLLSRILSITLQGWLMRLMVQYFWQFWSLYFFDSVINSDCVHVEGHWPVCQILLQILVSMLMVMLLPPWVWSGCCWFPEPSLSSVILSLLPPLHGGWGNRLPLLD